MSSGSTALITSGRELGLPPIAPRDIGRIEGNNRADSASVVVLVPFVPFVRAAIPVFIGFYRQYGTGICDDR